MENQFFVSKHFFLENKTRKSTVVNLHPIGGEPVSGTDPRNKEHISQLCHADLAEKSLVYL
jgi:hypothetical protein